MNREDFDRTLLFIIIFSLLLLINKLELLIATIIIVGSYAFGQAWIGERERKKRKLHEK